MIYTHKNYPYFHYFSPTFARDWNKLSKKNPHLGKLEKVINSEEWVYQGTNGQLRNLINILLGAYYDSNPKKPLLLQLVGQNVVETIEKHSSDQVQVTVLNLDKAKKVLDFKSKIQGQKWPRILIGLSKYAVFRGVCICSLKGHEDSSYNKNYDSLMGETESFSNTVFEQYSSQIN